jgi:hypothetical protein
MAKRSLFHYFKLSPKIIRLTAMLSIRFPLSLPSLSGAAFSLPDRRVGSSNGVQFAFIWQNLRFQWTAFL